MIKLPIAFTERIKQQLGENSTLFLEAFNQPSPVSVRINPSKTEWENLSTLIPLYKDKIKWSENGYYLKSRPIFTLDPLFHSGAYYVQEASSMFLDYILKQILPKTPVKALDVCAAPGGKSTLLSSTLPEGSLLVSNEVIKARASILKENIIKWGHDNIVVTNSDPSRFSNLKGVFDIVLVDAPCSGEGMFRKDEKAVSEWSEKNTELCAERQKRIIKDVWNTLKPGGYFIYSTCTYNPGENEEIAEWIKKEYNAEPVKISHSFEELTECGDNIYGYRFYPHRTEGEGFFITVFEKTQGDSARLKEDKKKPTKSVIQLHDNLIKLLPPLSDYTYYKLENTVGIFPSAYHSLLNVLEKEVKVIYKGCELAEINYNKFKPLHSLALYNKLNSKNTFQYEVDKETALRFLKKEDIPSQGKAGEWLLITHKGMGLGWAKNAGNRLNNYYPKEWRIRMDINK